MLESFVAALNEREGEFVRLYEIRDALVKHFGSDRDARERLGVSSEDWSNFGRLANAAPLTEGLPATPHAAI